MSDVSLSADGERALELAETICARLNIAIVGAEHLLGGALLVLRELGALAALSADQIEAAMNGSQGVGSEALDAKVMFGSAARTAISFTASTVYDEGGGEIGARVLAIGAIASDEINPMFVESLGMTRSTLLAALGAHAS